MKNTIILYLCDDNQTFVEDIANRIKMILSKDRDFEIIKFTNGQSLISQWSKQFADVVFLDIDMPGISGFEAAEKLQSSKKNALIIFVTSHEDMVYQSWKYQPFWFVRKSHMEDLNVVFPRLLAKVDAEYEKENNYFNLQGENCVVELDINSLMYIESYKHNIIICSKNEKKQVRCKISDAEKQLFPLSIIRVQNGVLVNFRFISKITSREVILTNGYSINLSRDRISFVKDEFQRFLRSR